MIPGRRYVVEKNLTSSCGELEAEPVEYTIDYFWVVICKNSRFRHKGNIGYEHTILLGEADAYSSLPMLPDKIDVRCDSCGEEYSYRAKEIMRDEIQIPETFVPHPLFKFS